jgi:hypothetical protein
VPLDQKKEKRSGHRTQWAAPFAVASELCKRGYEVSFTMGNRTPLADLMVVSPDQRRMFLVDVKGLYTKNFWLIKPKQTRDELFYILAYVPNSDTNQFFVMTQTDVNSLIQSERIRLNWKEDEPMLGLNWTFALPYKDAWQVLPK